MSRRFLFIGKKIVLVPEGFTPTKDPTKFKIKPTNTFIQSPGPILLPRNEKVLASGMKYHDLHKIGAFGIVIGKTCSNLARESAEHNVAGFFTAVNLTTQENVDFFDTFCPVGEYIPKSAVNRPERIESWYSINNGKKIILDLQNFMA